MITHVDDALAAFSLSKWTWVNAIVKAQPASSAGGPYIQVININIHGWRKKDGLCSVQA